MRVTVYMETGSIIIMILSSKYKWFEYTCTCTYSRLCEIVSLLCLLVQALCSDRFIIIILKFFFFVKHKSDRYVSVEQKKKKNDCHNIKSGCMCLFANRSSTFILFDNFFVFFVSPFQIGVSAHKTIYTKPLFSIVTS